MPGDDLDDGLALDPDFVNAGDDDGSIRIDPLGENELVGKAQEPIPVARKKRKSTQKPSAEHKSKKPKPEPRPVVSMSQPPEVLCDILKQATVESFPKMSDFEREQFAIPESCLVDTTQFATERTLTTLHDFISTTCPSLASRIAQRPKHRAAPTAIVIASAALRVADLTRALRPLKGESGGDIAKLFARHFKLKDHVGYLAKTRVGVGVGTPSRISQLLLEPDALSVKALSHIVLDMSYIDSKQRSLLDIPETRADTLKGVLANPRIRERLANGKTKIALF